MTVRRIERLSGVSGLADRYDGYIVDLWGCVHDGVRPYPGAIACLQALKSAGKRIVLLSNAPRPRPVVQAQLRDMGVVDTLYDGLMTSGEFTRRLLLSRDQDATLAVAPWLTSLGTKALHIGGDHDLALFEGLGLELVETPEEADFVMNTGPDERRGKTEFEPYVAALDAAAARGLPMICANPDMEVIRDGKRLICAGLLAKIYEQKNGLVHWIGKPFAAVYEPVLAMLDTPRDRVIGVGDALATDVRGAAAAGVDALWILGGIHKEKLGDDPALAQAEADAQGLFPVASVPGLVW